MLKLSQAIDGYLLNVSARRLSPHTIALYQRRLVAFAAFIHTDPPLTDITTRDIERYFASCETLSNSTLFGYHNTLSGLWTWAVNENYAPENIVKRLKRPRPDIKVIEPFTKDEIRALLRAVEYSQEYTRGRQRPTRQRLPDAERNRAIILTLLDTGLRASELCSLTIADADLKRRQIRVLGKGNKERLVMLDPSTSKAIWKYLATRPEARVNEPLFATDSGGHIHRHNLYKMLHLAGDRAEVANVHPHRFRHTFAIQCLRNGMNIYELQALLGHESLEMVAHYLKLAEVDLENSHRSASPVANWKL